MLYFTLTLGIPPKSTYKFDTNSKLGWKKTHFAIRLPKKFDFNTLITECSKFAMLLKTIFAGTEKGNIFFLKHLY